MSTDWPHLITADPPNDHTRVRTALRHPLLKCGSLAEEIGHSAMMSFVKNADIGHGGVGQPRTNTYSDIMSCRVIITFMHPQPHAHRICLFPAGWSTVWHSIVVILGKCTSNTLTVVTLTWIHTSAGCSILSVWLQAIKPAATHTECVDKQQGNKATAEAFYAQTHLSCWSKHCAPRSPFLEWAQTTDPTHSHEWSWSLWSGTALWNCDFFSW